MGAFRRLAKMTCLFAAGPLLALSTPERTIAEEWYAGGDAETVATELPEAVVPTEGDGVPTQHPTLSGQLLDGDFMDCDSACYDDCCEPCCICPPGRIWARGEVLLWWVDGQNTPPLVTTSPPGTPINQAGVLGAPGTRVLFGGNELNDDMRVGGRFQIGAWLDDCQTIGIQAGAFFLGDDGDNFSAASNGTVIISRPFFDPSIPAQNAELVSFPRVLGGRVDVRSDSDVVGADIALRKNICCWSCPTCDSCGDVCGDCCGGSMFRFAGRNCYRFDLVTGFTYFDLDEGVSVAEDLTTLSGNQVFVPGTSIQVLDQFDTKNRFYGYQIGGVAEIYRGRWSFDIGAKVALGGNVREVDITGATRVTVPGGGSAVAPGGLLAQNTNIGHYENTRFCAIPEFNFNVGYQLTRHLRVFTGYTFIYASNVVRAGDQIDFAVNSTQIPPGNLVGPARPAFTFEDGDLWLQGISFGAEVRF